MKFLYVYGWGSNSESETFKNLKKTLPNHELICVDYDQSNPLEARNFLNRYVVDNNINGIIASSFGAFIGINIQHSVHKILINPCLKPSVELPKLESISSDKFLKECQYLESNMIQPDDEDLRFTTGFFGDKDELFSHKEYFQELGYFKIEVLENESHKLSNDGLQKVVGYIKRKMDENS